MASQRRSSGSTSQVGRLLTPADVKALVAAAIEGGLFERSRSLYLGGIPREIVHSIPKGEDDLAQFQHDLERFADLAAPGDDEVPLLQFLSNIADQLALQHRTQTEIFERYCKLVSERLQGPDSEQNSGNAPFTLASLIEGIDVTFVPIVFEPTAADLFYISSVPLYGQAPQLLASTEITEANLNALLKLVQADWPKLRPPLLDEARVALCTQRNLRRLARAKGRCFWCIEEGNLVARSYSGEPIDSASADLWLVWR